MIQNLKRNDEIITSGGIYGRVQGLADKVRESRSHPTSASAWNAARSRASCARRPKRDERRRRRKHEARLSRRAGIAVLLVAACTSIPTLVTTVPGGVAAFLPREADSPGPRSAGRYSFDLQVEVDKAVENSLGGDDEDLKRELATAQILTTELERVGQASTCASRPGARARCSRTCPGPVPDPGTQPRGSAAGTGDVVLGLETARNGASASSPSTSRSRPSATASISSASASRSFSAGQRRHPRCSCPASRIRSAPRT